MHKDRPELKPSNRCSADKKRLLSKVRLVCFDFDGVFTDNRVVVSQDGVESVTCWRSDGIGLAKLRSSGVESVIVSTETNPVVEARSRKLGIDCFAGIQKKDQAVLALLAERGLKAEDAAFVGNDTPDLPAMRIVGVSIAVADAYPEVLRQADLVTECPGGFGAVREICDWIIGSHRS